MIAETVASVPPGLRAEAVDGRVQASRDFTDRAGDIRRRIKGTLGHAGLGCGLRYLRAHLRDLQA